MKKKKLTKDEIIAIQLSHNSLHGEDNKSILKKLFESIQSINFKKFAHINIDEIGTIDTNSLSLTPLQEFYTISIILYNDSLEYFNELIGNVFENAKKNDLVILADQEENEELYMRIKKEIKDKLNIKSANVAFCTILKLASERLKEISKEE